jgi:hypothetical protein
LTGHKTQGLTTDSIILSGLAPKDKSGVSGWLYVILSRVKTIEGLFLMENIEKNTTKYNARNDVKRKMNREPLIFKPYNDSKRHKRNNKRKHKQKKKRPTQSKKHYVSHKKIRTYHLASEYFFPIPCLKPSHPTSISHLQQPETIKK